jgi:hypothetical protein
MSSYNLQTTIGNLPTIVSSLNNLGTVNTQNSLAQTLSNGLNTFPVSLTVGTYIINYSINVYQTITTPQQFRSIECCLESGTTFTRDNTYESFDYVQLQNTFNTDYITCSKTFIMQITSAGTYNLLVNIGIGSGYTYYCNIYFQTVRIL